MRQRDDDSNGSIEHRVRPAAVQRLLGNVHVTGPDVRWVAAMQQLSHCHLLGCVDLGTYTAQQS